MLPWLLEQHADLRASVLKFLLAETTHNLLFTTASAQGTPLYALRTARCLEYRTVSVGPAQGMQGAVQVVSLQRLTWKEVSLPEWATTARHLLTNIQLPPPRVTYGPWAVVGADGLGQA